MRPGTTGEIQVPPAAVAEQLLQAMDAVALRAVIDIGTHEVVVTRQVGVDGGAGHDDLLSGRGARGAHHSPALGGKEWADPTPSMATRTAWLARRTVWRRTPDRTTKTMGTA